MYAVFSRISRMVSPYHFVNLYRFKPPIPFHTLFSFKWRAIPLRVIPPIAISNTFLTHSASSGMIRRLFVIFPVVCIFSYPKGGEGIIKFHLRAEAFFPSRVRIFIVSLSNSANAPNIWNVSFPIGPEKSIFSFREKNHTLCSWSISKEDNKCERLRERRSIFHTVIISNFPFFISSIILLYAGLLRSAPVYPSSTYSHSFSWIHSWYSHRYPIISSSHFRCISIQKPSFACSSVETRI